MTESLAGMVVAICDFIEDDDEYRKEIIGVGRRILLADNNDECSSFVARVVNDDQIVVEAVFLPVDADTEVMFGGFQLDER